MQNFYAANTNATLYVLSAVLGRHVRFLLAIAVFVLLLPQLACSERESLTATEARALFAEAEKLELENKLHDAYYKYKQVETTYEVNDSLRSAAWDAAQRVRLLVESMHRDIEVELRRYFEVNGRYPESLTEIRERLPESTRAALTGFRYKRVGDTSFALEDGIVG